MLDILLIMCVFLSGKYLKYAFVSAILSTMTYGRYLFSLGSFEAFYAAVYVGFWVLFTYEFLRDNLVQRAKSGEQKLFPKQETLPLSDFSKKGENEPDSGQNSPSFKAVTQKEK